MKKVMYAVLLLQTIVVTGQNNFDQLNYNVYKKEDAAKHGTHYYLIDNTTNYNEVELSNDQTHVRMGMYNIFFNKPSGGRDSSLFLNIIELPNHSRFGIAGNSQNISLKSIKDRLLSTYDLYNIVKNSILAAGEDKISLVKSHHLRTSKLILVFKDDNEYFISSDALTISEIFMTEEYKGNIINYLNISQQQSDSTKVDALIKNERSLFNTDSLKEYVDRWLLIKKNANFYGAYQFKYTVGTPPYQGSADVPEYSYVAPLNGDILYIPNIGIVGGTYYNHFLSFYNWIPGVKRVDNAFFKALEINDLLPVYYFEKYTNWKWY
jgi:hypothetical protein